MRTPRGRLDTAPGPLFETPRTRLIAAASNEIGAILAALLDEPLRPAETMASEVREYLVHLERQASEGLEFLDLETARRVGKQCLALLDRAASLEPRETTGLLVQVAARYFIEDEDAEGDTSSPIGFDDDAEVVELVARELGWEDLLN